MSDDQEIWTHGYNSCLHLAISALNYLSSHQRPAGGQEAYNAEHLLQIADEIKRTIAHNVMATRVWKPIDDDARDGREVLLRRGSDVTIYAGYYGLAPKTFGAGACTKFPWTILDNTNGVNNIRDGGPDGVTHYADISTLVAISPAVGKSEA